MCKLQLKIVCEPHHANCQQNSITKWLRHCRFNERWRVFYTLFIFPKLRMHIMSFLYGFEEDEEIYYTKHQIMIYEESRENVPTAKKWNHGGNSKILNTLENDFFPFLVSLLFQPTIPHIYVNGKSFNVKGTKMQEKF